MKSISNLTSNNYRVLAFATFGISGILMLFFVYLAFFSPNAPASIISASPKPNQAIAYRQFANESEYQEYLTRNQDLNSLSNFLPSSRTLETNSAPTTGSYGFSSYSFQSTRYSQTNNQVANIDEPDTLKTDGKYIVYSNPSLLSAYPIEFEMYRSAPSTVPSTTTIYQVQNNQLITSGEIGAAGDLLLHNNSIVLFTQTGIQQYQIQNPANAELEWQLSDDVQIQQSRLLNGKIYILFTKQLSRYTSCDNNLLENVLSVSCTDIKVPVQDNYTNALYTLAEMDPQQKSIKPVFSTLGGPDGIMYMSDNAMYLMYQLPMRISTLFSDMISSPGFQDVVSEQVIIDIKAVHEMTLSEETKMNEMSKILEDYRNTLPQEQRDTFDDTGELKSMQFIKNNARKYEKSGILRLSLSDYSNISTAQVEGYAQNQFSLDEYNNSLRVSVTVGDFFGLGRSIEMPSSNEIRTFDSGLNPQGALTDLGLTERIYATRFVGPLGYLVTYRETDPFYVLDLSDIKNPRKRGELKIPGYSSYLHPLSPDKILGVGKDENSKIKLSLFDVSNLDNPREVSVNVLTNEYYSETLSNHHAFLHDQQKQLFFLPGSQSAYLNSYTNNQLSIPLTINNIDAKRSVYIGDNIFIFGSEEVIGVNEDSMQEFLRQEL